MTNSIANQAGADLSANTDYVQSLDRGLAVIRCFDAVHQRLSIADIARETGLTRATARRFLHTLEHIGYVGSSEGKFHLRPRVLELGYAYLSSLSVSDIAQEHLVSLADHLHESCSASVLDDGDIVYVARAQTTRLMTITLALGSRLPAYATAMGRVLLAGLPSAELADRLASMDIRALTDRTITNRRKLGSTISAAGRQGYAMVDQELELGVRSIAVPIHDASGGIVAAINVAAHTSRVSAEGLRADFLPPLQAAAREIEADLAVRR